MWLIFLEEYNWFCLYVCSLRASDFLLEALWTFLKALVPNCELMNRYGVRFVFALAVKKTHHL